ncbi:23S ribosomal RNA methyltransferase [Metschnikowia bicuspidata]|uniref:rRNA methyltransferase 2, mitochondrial n=1 Tax=Metschnikowia bicuspidata TaxID=27322 RepID=A0A4P9ZDU2_9ASCO|nr:23S ribosomal RNA methyltransferase [Metschnikowia bicuspidata]
MDDQHTKQSKEEGFRSRAAYKLIEIDQKYNIFSKKTSCVVDLGFAPGAWSQVALRRAQTLQTTIRVLGVDLIDCSPPAGADFLQGDILSKKTHAAVRAYFSGGVDVVLSDMMANTSGIKDVDHYASMDLCDGVLVLACELLRKNGSLVMKYYAGAEDQLLHTRLQKMFHRVHRVKPDASRAELRELYFACLRRKPEICAEKIFGP